MEHLSKLTHDAVKRLSQNLGGCDSTVMLDKIIEDMIAINNHMKTRREVRNSKLQKSASPSPIRKDSGPGTTAVGPTGFHITPLDDTSLS
jgi:hypothetical protein